MALTAVVMKDILTGSELVSTILNESSSALQEFEVGSDDNPNEEDDI